MTGADNDLPNFSIAQLNRGCLFPNVKRKRNVTIGVQFIIRKSRLLQFTYLHTFFPEEFDGNDICIRVG